MNRLVAFRNFLLLHFTKSTKQEYSRISSSLVFNHKRFEYDNNGSNQKNRITSFPYALACVLPIISAKELDNNNNNYESGKKSKRMEFNFIADAVEKVLPSVVSIEVKEKVEVFHGFGYRSNRRPDTATITTGSGSGFVVDGERGLVLTNAHVVRNYNSILSVKSNDGKSYTGKVIEIDKQSDLALVKIDCVRNERFLFSIYRLVIILTNHLF